MSVRALTLGFLGQGWFPDAGGVESHTRDLARELLARGHRVRALVLDYGEREPFGSRVETIEGVVVERVAYRHHDQRALADLVEHPRLAMHAVQWARAAALDLVHVHHATGFGSGVLLALRDAGVPLVMTLHDYWSLCPRGQMVQPDGTVGETIEPERCGACLARTWPHLMPSARGERRGPGRRAVADDTDAARARTAFALRALQAPARLFTPSQAAKRVYVRAGVPAERIEVVPNGIDTAGLAAEVARLRAARGQKDTRASGATASGGEVRLGILGAVLPSKGALELARAFLAADVPGLALEIHGDLPSYHGDRSYVEELLALAAREPRVRVHGPYRHDRLAEILAGLDGVAAPSRWCEVFGLTVREARAAGLPVLVSSAGDLAAVAAGGRAGLVVDPDDLAGWARALRAFADPANRARWREHREAPRTARDMALELERAYREVLEGGR
jgi:glycosyltransferase involved in cell wall biosynthesis